MMQKDMKLLKPYRVITTLNVEVEAKNPLLRKLTKKKCISVPIILPFKIAVGETMIDAQETLKLDIIAHFKNIHSFKRQIYTTVESALSNKNAREAMQWQTVDGRLLDDILSNQSFSDAVTSFVTALPLMRKLNWKDMERVDFNSMGEHSIGLTRQLAKDVMHELTYIHENYPIDEFAIEAGDPYEEEV